MTHRQAEIVDLVAGGKTNKEIARALGVSERAVKARASRLYRSFGVPNRAGLVARIMAADAAPADGPYGEYKNAPFSVIATEGIDHRIVFVNAKFARLAGVRPEAIEGRRLEEAWPGLPSEWRAAMDEVLRTGHSTVRDGFDHRWARVDGEMTTQPYTYVFIPTRSGRTVGVLHLGVERAAT
jgi:DNA-binding CsgD family transcriptional regulator